MKEDEANVTASGDKRAPLVDLEQGVLDCQP